MSYDLEIALRDRPSHGSLMEALAGEDVEVEGSLGTGWVAVSRRGARRASPAFSIDGPMEVEPEDLSPELLEIVLLPRWLLQMNLPASRTETDLRLAIRIARSIAQAHGGAVYDPQRDQVWPRRRAPMPVSHGEEPIQVIDLEWFYPGSRADDPDLPRELLAVLKARCPEAVPRRFGHGEPLPLRFDREGHERFVAEWMGGPMGVSWTGTRPALSGHFSTPYRGRPPEQRFPFCAIALSFDGRSVGADPAWADVIVDVFVWVSRRTGPFYAQGSTSEAVAERGRVWYRGDFLTRPEREVSQQEQDDWMGLPSTATWLAWFGPRYRSALEGSLPPDRSSSYPEGVLFRASLEPLAVEHLRDEMRWIPAELQRGWRWRRQTLMSDNYEMTRARIIPPLE